MPTYEYLCKACRHEWSVEQRIVAPPLTECPKCHQPMAERQISAGNFILKGGGWYADAYSSPSKKSEDKGDSAKPDAKPDAKPADAPAAAATPKETAAKTPTTPPKAT
jgi:putative FmdB family regulatory protein